MKNRFYILLATAVIIPSLALASQAYAQVSTTPNTMGSGTSGTGGTSRTDGNTSGPGHFRSNNAPNGTGVHGNGGNTGGQHRMENRKDRRDHHQDRHQRRQDRHERRHDRHGH